MDESSFQPQNSNFAPPVLPYEQSCPLPSELLRDYWGIIEPRVHRFADETKEIAFHIHEEWAERTGLHIDGDTKSISEAGGLNPLCFPEADRERLRNMAGLVAMMFLDDDYKDSALSVDQGELDADKHRKIAILRQQIRSKLFVEGVTSDRSFLELMNSWDKWIQQSQTADKKDILEIGSLDEQLKARLNLSGAVQYYNMMLYCCNLDLSNEQLKKLVPIRDVALKLRILGNDIYSFDREWIAHACSSKPSLPPTAISYFLQKQDVSVLEAKKLTKQMYIQFEHHFLQLRQQLLEEHAPAFAKMQTNGHLNGDPESSKPAPDIVKCLSYIQHIFAGNLIFSIHHKRFRTDPKHRYFPKPNYKIGDLLNQLQTNQKTNHQENNRKRKAADFLVNGNHAIKQKVAHNGEDTNGEKTGLDAAPWLANYPALPDDITLAPFEYVASLSGKNVRKVLIDSLDAWYKVPQDRLDIIAEAINLLHSSSLISDDIEDGSSLRRGNPAAHKVFGTPQAMNSANYLLVKSFIEVQKLSPRAVAVYSNELRELHVGQGYDLYTIYQVDCPSVSEYIRIADGKTGGLFRLVGSLMRTEATQHQDLCTDELLTLLGRYYQIWDDYNDMIAKDGSASDLDEGVYSFTLVHTLSNGTPNDVRQLKGLLQMRFQQGGLTKEQKETIMRIVKRSGSLEYTLTVLDQLQDAIECKLVEMESTLSGKSIDSKNWIFRGIMAKIRVYH
ncbi:hypothetical protein TWF694_011552 [Orbilia ellipsospora]|uniref:Uncharacterized protein n=1 Tax=Orbilia ellipsospora TaxID=2528407 RepID=A0AAV9X6T6_9PEZI